MKIKDIIKALETLDQDKELKFLYDSFETYDFYLEDCIQQNEDCNKQFSQWKKGDYIINIG